MDENLVWEKIIPSSPVAFALRHCLSTGILSLTSCSVQSQGSQFSPLPFWQYWAVLQFSLLSQFATAVPVISLVLFALLALFFQSHTTKCILTLKKSICFTLYSSTQFCSFPVDLGEMETESVGSNSTESQTSCQDNNVSISVICIIICW